MVIALLKHDDCYDEKGRLNKAGLASHLPEGYDIKRALEKARDIVLDFLPPESLTIEEALERSKRWRMTDEEYEELMK